MSLPDVTPAQVVAIVQAVVGVAVAFGAPLSDVQSGTLLGLVGLIAAVLIPADASIRRKRAENADKIAELERARAATPGDPAAPPA